MNAPLSTRRLFLQKGLALLAAAPTIPSFLDRTMMALADPLDVKRVQQPTGSDGRILVIVQLSGGNDGLNMVIPYADDAYHRVRPGLAHNPDTVLKINSYMGLHPNLAPLKSLYDDGRMAVVQGVGYPNPNRSHFRSMDIWHSAAPEIEHPTSGWLGRYFDNSCSGVDPHVGISIGETMPLAMMGQRITPLSFDRPETYRYRGADTRTYLELNRQDDAPATQPATRAANSRRPAEPATESSEIEFLSRTAMDAQLSSDQILKAAGQHKTKATYPGGEFGNALRTVSALIAGNLPTRVYYVSLGGFDTHAGERGRHDQLMNQLGQGLSAFNADLREQGNEDRVLVMTFSEFGRRVEQNASGGTDHGAAAPMFIVGGGVRPGVVGRHPSLTDLDRGDLKHNVDFRAVYATLLQNWLQSPSKPILGQQYKLLDLVKA
jgi:uncharacterized protein (DUF1501 family)